MSEKPPRITPIDAPVVEAPLSPEEIAAFDKHGNENARDIASNLIDKVSQDANSDSSIAQRRGYYDKKQNQRDRRHAERLYTKTEERHEKEAKEEEIITAQRKEILPGALEKLKEAPRSKKTREKIETEIADLRNRANRTMVRGERAELLAQIEPLEARLNPKPRDTQVAPEVPPVAPTEEAGAPEPIGADESHRRPLATPAEDLGEAVIEEPEVPDARQAMESYQGGPALETSGVVITTPEGPISPEPKAETMEAFRDAVSQFKPIEEISQARLALDKKQDEYFDSLKAHHKRRSLGNVMAEQFFGPNDKIRGDALFKRREWLEERANLAKIMLESADTRYKERLAKGKKIEGLEHYRGKGDLMQSAVMERYQRRFVAKEMVLGREEAEKQARIEGLDARDKKMIDKLYDGYKKLPPSVRILGSSALIFGTGAALTSITGGAVALVPLAMGGTSAILRWQAQVRKNPTAKSWMGTAATALGVAGLVGLAGDYATKGIHKLAGTEKKAKEALESRSKLKKVQKDKDGNIDEGSVGHNLGNLTDVGALTKLSGNRRKALGAKERVDRDARWTRLVSSLTVGAVAGVEIHHVADQLFGHPTIGGVDHGTVDHHSAAVAHKPAPEHAAAKAPATHPEAAKVETPKAAGADTHVKAEAPVHAKVEAPKADVPPAQTFEAQSGVAGHGDGAERMFEHLQHNLKTNHIDSPLSKYLLGLKPDKFAQVLKLVAYEKGGLSHNALIHQGDSFTVNDHGQLMFKDHLTGHETEVMHMDANATVPKLNDHFFTGKMLDIHHVTHHAPTSSAEAVSKASAVDATAAHANTPDASATDHSADSASTHDSSTDSSAASSSADSSAASPEAPPAPEQPATPDAAPAADAAPATPDTAYQPDTASADHAPASTDHGISAEHTEPWVNKAGYTIDPNNPEVYKSDGYLEAWGKTYEDQVNVAQDYFNIPQHYGHQVFIEHSVINHFTNESERVVSVITTDAQGNIQAANLTEDQMASIPPFDPETFTPPA